MNIDIILSLQINALRQGDWASFEHLYQINDCSILPDLQKAARLYAVIRGDHVLCLKKLEEMSQNKSTFYEQIWYHSANMGSMECLNYAIANDVKVDNSFAKKIKTAMNLAARYGHLDIVKHLFFLGATSIRSATTNAAAAGYLNVVQFFSEIVLNFAQYAQDAFTMATIGGHLEVAKHVYSFGVDISISGNHLVSIVAQRGHVEMLKFLQSVNVNILADSSHVFQHAVRVGNIKMIEYLVSQGANVTASNNHVICLAAERGDLEIVTFFASLGANIRAQNNKPLMWSALNGHINIVKFLVSRGAKSPTNLELIKIVALNHDYEMVDYLASVKSQLMAKS